MEDTKPQKIKQAPQEFLIQRVTREVATARPTQWGKEILALGQDHSKEATGIFARQIFLNLHPSIMPYMF